MACGSRRPVARSWGPAQIGGASPALDDGMALPGAVGTRLPDG